MKLDEARYIELLEGYRNSWHNINAMLADWDRRHTTMNKQLEDYEFYARKKLDELIMIGYRMRLQGKLA